MPGKTGPGASAPPARSLRQSPPVAPEIGLVHLSDPVVQVGTEAIGFFGCRDGHPNPVARSEGSRPAALADRIQDAPVDRVQDDGANLRLAPPV